MVATAPGQPFPPPHLATTRMGSIIATPPPPPVGLGGVSPNVHAVRQNPLRRRRAINAELLPWFSDGRAVPPRACTPNRHTVVWRAASLPAPACTPVTSADKCGCVCAPGRPCKSPASVEPESNAATPKYILGYPPKGPRPPQPFRFSCESKIGGSQPCTSENPHPQKICMPHQSQRCDGSVAKSMGDGDLFRLSAASSLLSLCLAHRCCNAAFSLCCAPVAHWDAFGRGGSHCISWYQIQFILTTPHVRSLIALWDNRSIGRL